MKLLRPYATGTINPKNLNEDVTKAVTKLVQKFVKNQAGFEGRDLT